MAEKKTFPDIVITEYLEGKSIAALAREHGTRAETMKYFLEERGIMTRGNKDNQALSWAARKAQK